MDALIKYCNKYFQTYLVTMYDKARYQFVVNYHSIISNNVLFVITKLELFGYRLCVDFSSTRKVNFILCYGLI